MVRQILKYSIYSVVLIFLSVISEFSLSAQEVLKSSRIEARANRKNLPDLGLPLRSSGEMDPVIWYKEGCWRGADSLKAAPFWMTETIVAESVVKTQMPSEIVDFCKKWVMEKPQGPVHIVSGPVRGMQFIAVCTRSRSSLIGNR